MPNPRFNPYGEYPRIVADVPTYLAILRREHLPPTPLTNDQIVAVYRDWLKVNAVRLDWRGGYYDFTMFPAPALPKGCARKWLARSTCSVAFPTSIKAKRWGRVRSA